MPIGTIKRLVIHHQGGPENCTVAQAKNFRDKSTAAGIKKYHVETNGWSDIGYHKVIRGSGLLENGRSETTLGSHVKNGNTGALGVCCTGHFGLVEPTSAQIDTLVKLLADWCKKYLLSVTDIYGHHNVPVGTKKPACPGKNMVSKFDSIKSRVTSAIMPPKYVLSAKVNDLSIRRLLEKAIDDDGRLSYQEIHDLVAAVVGDGQVTPQELRDMQAIATHSQSLQGPGRTYLQVFLANPQVFIDHNRKITEGSTNGSAPANNGSAQSNNASQSPTQQANNEFYRRHPHRKGKLLTSSAADKPYRVEWMKLYKGYGGT
jgi:hypothetical protein